ncbi:hypothetical protein M231_05843 [Tremella mesenterica]|uniref:Uncharacterized protein n=1 Tax=Tremella mesenterica TaxID=5217 RepID=A0A4Q1BH17_TREME|nr:hypothetical protein M231_05843 [Tremella mesenterica]
MQTAFSILHGCRVFQTHSGPSTLSVRTPRMKKRPGKSMSNFANKQRRQDVPQPLLLKGSVTIGPGPGVRECIDVDAGDDEMERLPSLSPDSSIFHFFPDKLPSLSPDSSDIEDDQIVTPPNIQIQSSSRSFQMNNTSPTPIGNVVNHSDHSQSKGKGKTAPTWVVRTPTPTNVMRTSLSNSSSNPEEKTDSDLNSDSESILFVRSSANPGFRDDSRKGPNKEHQQGYSQTTSVDGDDDSSEVDPPPSLKISTDETDELESSASEADLTSEDLAISNVISPFSTLVTAVPGYKPEETADMDIKPTLEIRRIGVGSTTFNSLTGSKKKHLKEGKKKTGGKSNKQVKNKFKSFGNQLNRLSARSSYTTPNRLSSSQSLNRTVFGASIIQSPNLGRVGQPSSQTHNGAHKVHPSPQSSNLAPIQHPIGRTRNSIFTRPGIFSKHPNALTPSTKPTFKTSTGMTYQSANNTQNALTSAEDMSKKGLVNTPKTNEVPTTPPRHQSKNKLAPFVEGAIEVLSGSSESDVSPLVPSMHTIMVRSQSPTQTMVTSNRKTSSQLVHSTKIIPYMSSQTSPRTTSKISKVPPLNIRPTPIIDLSKEPTEAKPHGITSPPNDVISKTSITPDKVVYDTGVQTEPSSAKSEFMEFPDCEACLNASVTLMGLWHDMHLSHGRGT